MRCASFQVHHTTSAAKCFRAQWEVVLCSLWQKLACHESWSECSRWWQSQLQIGLRRIQVKYLSLLMRIVNVTSPSSLKYSSLRRAERRLQLHARTDEEKQIWAAPHLDNRHPGQWKPLRVVRFREIQFPIGKKQNGSVWI